MARKARQNERRRLANLTRWAVSLAIAIGIVAGSTAQSPWAGSVGQIGRAVLDDSMAFTVQKIERLNSISSAGGAIMPQGEFLAVYLRLENGTSVETRQVTPDMIEVIDAQGQRHQWDAQVEAAFLANHPGDASIFEKANEIWPSSWVYGWAIFDVPRAPDGFKLRVKGSESSDGTLIDLGP